MSLNHDKYLIPIGSSKLIYVPKKFRSLSVDKELEMLWTQISLINYMLEKLIEIAEWERKIDYDTKTGDIIVLDKDQKQQPLQPSKINKYHNPYV